MKGRTIRTRPLLVTGLVLLVLVVATLGLTVRRSPAPPGDSARSPEESVSQASASGRLGWQWCPDAPDPAIPPDKAAPTRMGAVRNLRTGALDIQWSWCRAQASYDLVVVRARVTNTGDASLDHVLLAFSLYDQNGGFIGIHSMTMQRLDAHGAASIEGKLPTQYGDWSKWTAWSMKLASVDAD